MVQRKKIHHNGASPVSCGTLEGDLNNPLGSQKARKEKGSQPPSHMQFGKKQINEMEVCIYIFMRAFC
jgi:hypothetical protein